jgi:hypothetical protein
MASKIVLGETVERLRGWVWSCQKKPRKGLSWQAWKEEAVGLLESL